MPPRLRSWLRAMPLGLALALPPPALHAAPVSLAVSYTGTDYYYPSDYFAGCPKWTWLRGGCYTSNPTGGPITAQHLLASDASWITAHHMGQFVRLWVMLDQGIRWDAGTYQGLDPQYLSNLDDALATLHANGIRADLVLYEASQGSADQNQFEPAALDGQHAARRAGYLQALRDLAAHLAAHPVDAQAVAVVDAMNEAYFQLARFGLSDQAIHAFLHDAYAALKAGAPTLLVTVSDTTRLLKDQGAWWPLYADALDVIDEHAYSDAPWSDAALWEHARALPVPWFVGEAGCAPGHVSCTYRGDVSCQQPAACALSIDSWWLANLRADGAQAVLIEEQNTAWSYPSGPDSQTPTLVGQAIALTAPSCTAGFSPEPASAATHPGSGTSSAAFRSPSLRHKDIPGGPRHVSWEGG